LLDYRKSFTGDEKKPRIPAGLICLPFWFAALSFFIFQSIRPTLVAYAGSFNKALETPFRVDGTPILTGRRVMTWVISTIPGRLAQPPVITMPEGIKLS
jgi:hypothetical protein